MPDDNNGMYIYSTPKQENKMNNEELRSFIKEAIERELVSAYYEGEKGLENYLDECPELWQETTNSRRWWDDTFKVVEVGDKLIGYASAVTTGDDSPYDKGWEFDPSSITEVEKYEVTLTKYKPKTGE